MTLGAAPGTEPLPRRGRPVIPAGIPRRREVLALFAVTIVAGHLVFTPVTFVVAIVLAAAARASRWRPSWLAVPASVGLAWLLATGLGNALAAFTAWPSGILGSLSAGHRSARPGHPFAAFHAAWSTLPGQLPLALICGAAEAAVLGWLAWLHTDEWSVPAPRPGALAAVRARYAGAVIRAGAVLTSDGCALGVEPTNGDVAELRWTEMSGGLLVTGDDPQDVALASLQVVHAALRRRKPLIVVDQGEGGSLGRALTAACMATGTPLRTDGSAMGVAVGAGSGGAGGPGDVGDGAGAWGAGVMDGARAGGGAEVAGGAAHGSASALWGRAREDPPGDTGSVRTSVDLHQVILERSAGWLSADSAETVSRACADLTGLAQHLRAIAVDGDGLIWIPRGEHVPVEDLAALLREAPAAGLPVLVGTTSHGAAAALAGLTGATLIHRVADPALATHLADLTGSRLLPASEAAALPGGAGLAGGAGFACGAGFTGGAGFIGGAGQNAGPTSLPAMPAMPPMPAMPAVSSPHPIAMPPGTAMPPAVPAHSAAPVEPGAPAMPGVDLVRCPVVPPWTLRALRPGEFVLAVHVPYRRLIALGQLVPARLPHQAEPAYQGTPPGRTEPSPRTEPPARTEPQARTEPPPGEIQRPSERWW